jgi:lipid-A-disaccharide synthase
VNLVLGERLVPELLQEDLRVKTIVAEALPLLDPSGPGRLGMLAGYDRLRLELGEPGVTQRAACAILNQVLAGKA